MVNNAYIILIFSYHIVHPSPCVVHARYKIHTINILLVYIHIYFLLFYYYHDTMHEYL